jgi:hypothetical protein
VSFPKSISLLAQRSLSNTKSLQSVSFDEPSELKAIVADAFWSTSIENMQLLIGLRTIQGNFVDTHNLTTIVASEEKFVFNDGMLSTRDEKLLLFGVRTPKYVGFSADVEVICADAFYGCNEVTGLVFPRCVFFRGGIRKLSQDHLFGYFLKQNILA